MNITNSERLTRWLLPPPARTAAFSKLRSPGVVLRVSNTATPPAASTKALVWVAMPERCPKKLSATRSAVQMEANEPETSAMACPAFKLSPSVACQASSTSASTKAKASCAQAVPAKMPLDLEASCAVAWTSVGNSEAVRSPSGPTSSANARSTASRTSAAGGTKPGTKSGAKLDSAGVVITVARDYAVS